MAKQSKGELVPVLQGFDYAPLEAPVAQKLRSTVERIRDRLKKTLADFIEIGTGLLEAKDALPHGQFGPWLRAEFGWRERHAENFISVAKRFGPKTEIIADLTKLGGRLLKALEGWRERWNPRELAELARQLREFADALDEQKSGKKGRAKE